MSKHTPGPWIIKEYGRSTSDNEYDHSEIHIGRRIGSFEVKVITDRPITSMREVAINAALIGAAPDLLEALDYALSALAHCRADKGYGSMQSRAANLAANAIAKARGEA